jgi:APA family basic amino acid/polyamine antiporter
VTSALHDTAPSGDRTSRGGGLLRVLGVAFGVAVLIGNTIGMGILRTPGEVAERLPSGPLFMGVWAAGGLYALLGAMTVAELAALRPRTGGPYALVADALGPYPGFVTGWVDWLGICGAAAGAAVVLAEYAVPLLPALDGNEPLGASVVVLALAAMQWRGIRVSDAAQRGLSLLKTLALLALAAAAFAVEPSAADAAAPASVSTAGGFAAFGAFVLAIQAAIYTYDGWTGPTYFGAETVDAERSIPRAMIGGILLVTVVYLMLNAAFLRVLPISRMAGDPFVAGTAAARIFGSAGDPVMRGVMIVSLVAAMNAVLLMGARVPYAMSEDRLLPAAAQAVTRGTPVLGLAATTAAALAFIHANTFDTLLAVVAFLFVVNYTFLFAGLFASRWREPQARRPFRVPLFPLVPAAALAGSCLFLAAAIATDFSNSVRGLALFAVSWPIYRAATWKRSTRRASG